MLFLDVSTFVICRIHTFETEKMQVWVSGMGLIPIPIPIPGIPGYVGFYT
jgi:hypothetical protein